MAFQLGVAVRCVFEEGLSETVTDLVWGGKRRQS